MYYYCFKLFLNLFLSYEENEWYIMSFFPPSVGSALLYSTKQKFIWPTPLMRSWLGWISLYGEGFAQRCLSYIGRRNTAHVTVQDPCPEPQSGTNKLHGLGQIPKIPVFFSSLILTVLLTYLLLARVSLSNQNTHEDIFQNSENNNKTYKFEIESVCWVLLPFYHRSSVWSHWHWMVLLSRTEETFDLLSDSLLNLVSFCSLNLFLSVCTLGFLPRWLYSDCPFCLKYLFCPLFPLPG